MMNKYEDFACGQIMSYYPQDKTFAEILALLRDQEAWNAYEDSIENKDDYYERTLVACEDYDHCCGEEIATRLEELAESAQHHFGADND